MIKKKIEKNKNSGFVILFAVTLAAILLSIALGVGGVAYKEIRFSTSVKDSNDAFYAADTGVEQALYADKSFSITQNATSPITLSVITPSLGSGGLGCVNVTTIKTFDNNTPPTVTSTAITAKGYNIGNAGCIPSNNSNQVERQIETNY